MYDFEGEQNGTSTAAGAPPRVLTLLELPRVTVEYGASRMLDLAAPARDLGQGRPVLVIPGFSADDRLTGRLRAHLTRQGFAAHGWNLGTNRGLTEEIVAGLPLRFAEIAAGSDQKVAIVGWSFGGLLARWLAHQNPDRVSQVICLGSPWRAEGERTRATAMFERSRVKYGMVEHARDIIDQLRQPVPVPLTAVWSRTDGIVPWQGCAVDERTSPLTYNVEVLSSHVGMVSNPLVLKTVVKRLAA